MSDIRSHYGQRRDSYERRGVPVGHCDPVGCHPAGSGYQAYLMAKKHLPGKGEQKKLPVRRNDISHIVCGSCECVSGYGLPPSVQECPCVCHDTARRWWNLWPWRAEV